MMPRIKDLANALSKFYKSLYFRLPFKIKNTSNIRRAHPDLVAAHTLLSFFTKLLRSCIDINLHDVLFLKVRYQLYDNRDETNKKSLTQIVSRVRMRILMPCRPKINIESIFRYF